jgi:ABC-2 type transport system permease protein
MTHLLFAEARKLLTTRLWLWLLLLSLAWTAGYASLAIALAGQNGSLTPPLSGAAGQHALFGIGAGGAGPVTAILAAIGTAGEYRHRTAATTFLVTPRRVRVITAKLITYLMAGACYGLVCIVLNLAIALPWLRARGIAISPAGQGNIAVLAAVIISAAIFGLAGVGLGAILGSQIAAVAGLLLYLYVAEPLVSHIGAWHSWTAYLPGVAADGLTQASQAGVRLLAPWLGGLIFTAWAAVFAVAGMVVTARRDIT